MHARAVSIAWLVVAAIVVPSTRAAARPLELRVDPTREMIIARVPGEPVREPVFLRDVDRDRRVPALEVSADAGGLVARFDLRTLSPDGKSHQLALEWSDVEIARGALVLPGADEPSWLRWLVIAGPLIGLAMIGAAIWIGRRLAIGRPRGD